MGGFKDSDDFFKTEEEIILYINSSLKLDFCRPTEDVMQTNNAVTFTGRPSAVIYKEDKTLDSLLIIKTIFSEESFDLTNPYESHILQLSFNLYLAGLDVGYLCLCLMSHEKEAITEFKSHLKMNYMEPNQNYIFNLLPKFQKVRSLPVSYQILRFWSNNKKLDSPLLLWEIKIDSEKIQWVIKNYADWWQEHLWTSPNMTKKELRLARKAIRKCRKR